MKVKEIMNKDVITISPEKSILELAEIFAQPNVGGMPVIDSGSNMIGLVTMPDFISYFLPDSLLLIQELTSLTNETMEKDILSVDLKNTKVKDIMGKKMITIKEEESIIKAAALFYEHKVRIIPVVNSEEKLVGVVTLSDICKGIYEIISKTTQKESNQWNIMG